jgi:hypothetical protein
VSTRLDALLASGCLAPNEVRSYSGPDGREEWIDVTNLSSACKQYAAGRVAPLMTCAGCGAPHGPTSICSYCLRPSC